MKECYHRNQEVRQKGLVSREFCFGVRAWPWEQDREKSSTEEWYGQIWYLGGFSVNVFSFILYLPWYHCNMYKLIGHTTFYFVFHLYAFQKIFPTKYIMNSLRLKLCLELCYPECLMHIVYLIGCWIGQISFGTSLFGRNQQTEKAVQTQSPLPLYSVLLSIDETFFFFLVFTESENSQSRTYTSSLNYCTVLGTDTTSSKHKSCCTMKAKMDQANDVTSPPLNSCLCERYDEAITLKYLVRHFPIYDICFIEMHVIFLLLFWLRAWWRIFYF